MRYILLLFTIIALSSTDSATAQATEENPNYYQLSSEIYTATDGNLPFWFYSNVYGTVDPSSTNWLNRISVNHQLINENQKSVSIGGETVLQLSDDSSILFPELFLSAKAYGLQLDIGRFPQPIGLNNQELSSGSMMVSPNAMPVPKISISTPEYLNVPLTDGHLQYKGMFSHGWLEEDRYVSNAYLHQKYLYLRVNLGDFSVTGGLVHNAQWGGTSPQDGRLPRSFNDYLRLITGQGADSSSDAPGGEKSNVIGNSVAAYDFGLTYDHEDYTLTLTRMFYLEDKVSTRFRSPWDGVWGVNFQFDDTDHLVNAITYEHINTKNQDAKSWELIGRRDYYDNFVYESGWTYENRTLGTPLILFNGTTITNNVLVGHHVGISGQITGTLTYKAFFTYSRNYGVQSDWIEGGGGSIPKDSGRITPIEQFRADQYSLLVEFNYPVTNIRNFQIHLQLASDIGELYDDNLGIMIGISWGNTF